MGKPGAAPAGVGKQRRRGRLTCGMAGRDGVEEVRRLVWLAGLRVVAGGNGEPSAEATALTVAAEVPGRSCSRSTRRCGAPRSGWRGPPVRRRVPFSMLISI